MYSIKDFKDRFAFKGGTALSKCFLNYHRFSVDLDFTYALAYREIEDRYSPMNQKKKAYDAMRRFVGHTLQIVADNLKDSGIRFIYDPSNKEWVHIKYNKMIVTYIFKIKIPDIKDKTLKVEMNFTDKLYFKPAMVIARTYGDISLYDYKPVEVLAYSPIEILVEKYKTMVSRVMWRDYFDAYFLYKKYRIEPLQVKDTIVKKLTSTSLFKSERIREHTLRSIDMYSSELVTPEAIREYIEKYGDLIIEKLPSDFDDFVYMTSEQIRKIGKEVQQFTEKSDTELEI